ncbi:MAG: hypothetical protein KJ880_00125 [Candidatus Omnitrophica bacterium]|nr:hypothetical protein [Candidatus Omnitrophota bacterium]MBU1869280.1 hypothetical protein [Candidatus Omnitrophota bacterium]
MNKFVTGQTGKIKIRFIFIVIIFCLVGFYLIKNYQDNQVLRKVIDRLTADSRIAQVLVSAVKTDPLTNKTFTTIKFLEYDTKQNPLAPRYFTFSGNIIQFQSMVIRFDDFYVKKGDPLKGKSAYLFMKAFAFNGKNAEVFDINTINEIPSGYKIEKPESAFEKKLWERFWSYALEPKEAKKMGIRNAQIEAPGTKFVPGMLYTIKIEHDGGMRIDAQQLPKILKGEKIQ